MLASFAFCCGVVVGVFVGWLEFSRPVEQDKPLTDGWEHGNGGGL